MGAALVFLQHSQGRIIKGSLSAISAAMELKSAWSCGDLIGVVLGSGSKLAAEDAAQYGLAQVFFSERTELDNLLPLETSDAIAQVARACAADVIVAASTSIGKDVMPRVAVHLDGAQVSEVLAVNSDGSLVRPMYAGDVLATVALDAAVRIVTVRQTAFPPAAVASASGTVTESAIVLEGVSSGEYVGKEASGGERPELADASVVVSGGRALQSAENFQKVIFPLADVLGAAVGASRAAVDSGYAPNDWQVGQTGKVVAPQLYISVGISGAIQHLAGMKDSKVIVAINKDADAPIFEVADYGLVADLYQVVPELVEAIRAAKK